MPSTPCQGGANGTVGVKYSFAESYDGASCLCFTGVLNEKAAAAFTLYRSEVLFTLFTPCSDEVVLNYQQKAHIKLKAAFFKWGEISSS